MFPQEVCRIVRRHRREGPVSERDYFWYEAIVTGPTGEQVIARSQEWLHETQSLIAVEDAQTIHARNVKKDADSRAELVRMLLADGWEISSLNDRGLPATFQRSPRPTIAEAPTLDGPTLLKALDDLYQAGLLTAEELAAKKAALLKRSGQAAG